MSVIIIIFEFGQFHSYNTCFNNYAYLSEFKIGSISVASLYDLIDSANQTIIEIIHFIIREINAIVIYIN